MVLTVHQGLLDLICQRIAGITVSDSDTSGYSFAPPWAWPSLTSYTKSNSGRMVLKFLWRVGEYFCQTFNVQVANACNMYYYFPFCRCPTSFFDSPSPEPLWPRGPVAPDLVCLLMSVTDRQWQQSQWQLLGHKFKFTISLRGNYFVLTFCFCFYRLVCHVLKHVHTFFFSMTQVPKFEGNVKYRCGPSV